MVRVKICGITNLKDALAAVDAGADAIGFVFAKSPRNISPKEAKKIISAVGPWVSTVGVFVNEKPASIRSIALECGLDCVQLHGDESPDEAKALKDLKVIKAFGVGEGFKPKKTTAFDVSAYLFDTRSKDLFGGSGKSFDWNLLKSRKWKRPVILSGGLNPRNVAKAVQALSIYGVDVSSGVEKAPGKKDAKLIKEFIRNAKKNS